MKSKLDEYQRRALTDGHLLIMAGAGSGKTRTAVGYMRWLLETGRAEPGGILYLSFTNKAAREGARRAGDGVEARTIHSFCFKELRKFYPGIKVANDDVIKIASKELGCNVNPDDIEAYVLKFREVSNPKDVENVLGRLSLDNYITFGQMLTMYSDILEHPSYTPARYSHIVLDESQDLCSVQLRIVSTLAHRTGATLILVGDNRQCIYEWRGSDPGIVDTFMEEFSPVEVILKRTYRCGKVLSTIANAVAQGMPHHTDMESAGNGGSVLSLPYSPSVSIRIIRQNLSGTVAFLARTNREVLSVGAALRRDGIPYVWLANCSLMKTAYGKTIRAVIAAALYRNDPIAASILFKRIKVGVGEKTLRDYPTVELLKEINGKKKLVRFLATLETIEAQTPVEEVVCTMEPYIEDDLNRGEWVRNEYGKCSADNFLEFLNTLEETMETNDDNVGVYPVRLGTIHSAKGLEYDHVLLGLRWFAAKYPGGIPAKSEEKRVLYVGITRARKTLVLLRGYGDFRWFEKIIGFKLHTGTLTGVASWV